VAVVAMERQLVFGDTVLIVLAVVAELEYIASVQLELKIKYDQ
jgi:hypothetical protein